MSDDDRELYVNFMFWIIKNLPKTCWINCETSLHFCDHKLLSTNCEWTYAMNWIELSTNMNFESQSKLQLPYLKFLNWNFDECSMFQSHVKVHKRFSRAFRCRQNQTIKLDGTFECSSVYMNAENLGNRLEFFFIMCSS